MVINTLTGVAGGLVDVLVGQPLNTVKVKMQLFPKKVQRHGRLLAENGEDAKLHGLYAGTVLVLVSC